MPYIPHLSVSGRAPFYQSAVAWVAAKVLARPVLIDNSHERRRLLLIAAAAREVRGKIEAIQREVASLRVLLDHLEQDVGGGNLWFRHCFANCLNGREDERVGELVFEWILLSGGSSCSVGLNSSDEVAWWYLVAFYRLPVVCWVSVLLPCSPLPISRSVLFGCDLALICSSPIYLLLFNFCLYFGWPRYAMRFLIPLIY